MPRLPPSAYQLVTKANTRSFRAQILVDGVMTGHGVTLTGLLGYRILYVTRLTKSLSRVIDKVRSERANRPRETLEKIVEDATSDLAGGRFLVVGTDHVNEVLSSVKELIKQQQQSWGLPHEHADYVQTPKSGTRGWRAVVQDVTVPIGGVPTQFQLQVMTYLQHAWDQLDHAFYEQVRTGHRLPDGAKEMLGKLSDGLYRRDREMSTTRQCLMDLVVDAAGRGRRRPAAPPRPVAKKAARKA